MPLWIDLKFATIIVYSLDSLFNNFCKDLLNILEIMNYISITVFLRFTFNMLSPVPESVYLFKQKLFTVKVLTLCAFYLPPVFEKQWEVLFWVPSPSLATFCFISQLLLKLAFCNLTCAIYAKTILLKCF